MRHRYSRRKSRPTYTRRRRTTTPRRRVYDPIAVGAWIGGVAGIVLLLYGLVTAGHPGPAADMLAPGFALSLGVVLLIVSIALYFSAQAGWLDDQSANKRSVSRRRRTTRRYR